MANDPMPPASLLRPWLTPEGKVRLVEVPVCRCGAARRGRPGEVCGRCGAAIPGRWEQRVHPSLEGRPGDAA